MICWRKTTVWPVVITDIFGEHNDFIYPLNDCKTVKMFKILIMFLGCRSTAANPAFLNWGLASSHSLALKHMYIDEYLM